MATVTICTQRSSKTTVLEHLAFIFSNGHLQCIMPRSFVAVLGCYSFTKNFLVKYVLGRRRKKIFNHFWVLLFLWKLFTRGPLVLYSSSVNEIVYLTHYAVKLIYTSIAQSNSFSMFFLLQIRFKIIENRFCLRQVEFSDSFLRRKLLEIVLYKNIVSYFSAWRIN